MLSLEDKVTLFTGGSSGIGRAADVASLDEAVIGQYSRLDCAFNNAAELGEFRLIADYSEDEFDHISAVNLKSV